MPSVIHAGRVCANKVNHRLKGIEIFRSHIEAGRVRRDPAPAERYEQTPSGGSAEWRNGVGAQGEVAVGLIVNFEDGRGNRSDEMIGLALRCQEVRLGS